MDNELIDIVKNELAKYDGKKEINLYFKENPGWITITSSYEEIKQNGIMRNTEHHEDFSSRIMFDKRIVYIKSGTEQKLWDIIAREIFPKLAWMDTANWQFKEISLCSDMGITFNIIPKITVQNGTGVDGTIREHSERIHYVTTIKGCSCCDDCMTAAKNITIEKIKDSKDY